MGYVTYCSMCLGTDIKLYQMNSSMIAKYNELILRRYKMNLNPMYACYECSYLLQKYCEFQAKCCRANNILRITSHGSFEVTKQTLKEIDRKQNKLQSLLSRSGAVTDYYQHQQNCMETQVTHKDIKLESPVYSIEEQCNQNTIQIQLEKLEASALEASRVFTTDQSENSQIYTALISNIKTTLDEDNNYQNINELNTECFDYNSHEESAFVEMPDEENVVLSEIKVDEVYPTKLDVERSDNNCETESLEQPETVVITICDSNKIGSRKRKCISEENNKIPSKKSTKKNKRNNNLTITLECNINEDKNLNKNKTERRKGSRITAKKKEDCRYTISSSFFKDHMTIIELSPEDARCELLLRKESRNFKMSSHKCDLCYRGFISEATYLAHMKKHSLEYGAIKCDICQLNFSDKQSVSKHWAMCHSWKLLCKACSYMCFNVNQAKNHIESHNGKKYTCKECGEIFRFPNTLSTHMRIKHNTELACEFCGSMFASELGMKCHKSLRHKKEKKELLGPKCDECSVHFASELAWKRHRVLCSRHQVQNARNKVLLRKKGGHSAANMLKALKLHRSGESIRQSAKIYNIAYPTLRRYVAKNLDVNTEELGEKRLQPNYENHLVFTAEQEDSYKDYIKECALKFYGLTTKDCRKVAYQMAKVNNVTIPDSWERDKMAGKEWLRSFRKRHPDLTIKKPEACSLARATAFNRKTVKSFFDNLKIAMNRHPSFSTGHRLYNLDETATTTVQCPQKVVGPKRKFNIAKVTSGEKGTVVTTCAIVCASGQALPPALVFPRKFFKDFLLTGAPPGSLGLGHPSGRMTSELFVEVMKHFIKHSAASPENPALLILDNHESHLSTEALDLAKSSGVTILILHPHTTAKMQPLDVGLDAPFNVYYNSAIDSWMTRNPGKSMTIYNVAECVGVAYARAMTPINISAAFKKCGIFPYDPEVFSDIDFLPSNVTDRPEPQPNVEIESDDTFCEDGRESTSLLSIDNVIEYPPLNENNEIQPQISHSSPIPGSSTMSFISPHQCIPQLNAGPRTSDRKIRNQGKAELLLTKMK